MFSQPISVLSKLNMGSSVPMPAHSGRLIAGVQLRAHDASWPVPLNPASAKPPNGPD